MRAILKKPIRTPQSRVLFHGVIPGLQDRKTGVSTTRALRLARHGIQQSPIDLGRATKAFVASPQIDWYKVKSGQIKNTGHALEVALDKAGGLVLNGQLYKLAQMHFHTPSEHAYDGRRYPMEVHFVHKAENGALAVIGVMVAEGSNNPDLDPIWWATPTSVGTAPLSFEFYPENLLPTNRASMRYKGSLTTPPCSEIVDWTVLNTPITASRAQITVLKSLFGENARPLQPLHRRFVLETPH